MTHLHSSMLGQVEQMCLMRLSGQESSSVPSATPRVLWSSLHVMTTVKGFLPRHDSWDLIPHLMHSGSAVHIIAMWRALTGGINAPLV